jgi:hypothetical protein
MATITLSLSKKIDELEKSEIMIRFSVSQAQRYRIKSGFFISVNRWTKKNDIFQDIVLFFYSTQNDGRNLLLI